jgi:hypothetical protein
VTANSAQFPAETHLITERDRETMQKVAGQLDDLHAILHEFLPLIRRVAAIIPADSPPDMLTAATLRRGLRRKGKT